MSGSVDNLVKMANQIGDFFGTMKDHEHSLEEIAGHLRKFWAPSMRVALMAHLDQRAGVGLSDIVLESLKRYRERIV